MKHVTAPFFKQFGTTTSKIDSSYSTGRGYSTWAERFTLMLLFLFASQIVTVAQPLCDPPTTPRMDNTLISESIVSDDCNTIQLNSGESGNVFELTINPANQYVFTLCFDAISVGNSQFPQAELWADTTGNPASFIDATGSADTNNCTTVTYRPESDCTTAGSNLIYLATYSHLCISDWRALDIEVNCTACEIACGDPIFAAANNSNCTSFAFDFPGPIVSGSCDGNTIEYEVDINIGDYVTVVSDGMASSASATGSLMEGDSIGVLPGAPVGTHIITYSVVDCALDTTRCQQLIVIEPILACDDVVNVTLSQFCELQILPDFLLEAECADNSQYTVNILGQTNDIISAPGLYEVQIVYTPDVSNSASGNFCWGFINAEDKSGPTCEIERTQISISCGESADVGQPIFEDCSGVESTSMNTLNFGQCGEIDLSGTNVNPDTDGDGDLFDDLPFTVSPTIEIPALDRDDPEVAPFIAAGFVIDNVTVNTWTATDTNGFSTNSCQQFIYTWRPSVINLPLESVVVECGSSIDQDSLAAIEPQFLPHYSNPLYGTDDDLDNDLEFTRVDNDGDLEFLAITDANNNVCRFNVDSNDRLIGETCGMTEKYIREFTVLDWCEGVVIDSLDGFSQIIVLDDTTAPEFECRDSLAVGGNYQNPDTLYTTSSAEGSCGFEGLLMPPTATDFCSSPVDITANIFACGSTGTGCILVTQGHDLSNSVSLQRRNYKIEFIGTDECGNVSDPCTVFYTVVDNQSPVAICDGKTTVSLTNASNGVASICAENIDSGSFDNCGITSKMVKRMGAPDSTFASCISLDCEDAGQELMVEFRVTDAAGNSNACWVTVNVEDKVGPSIVCPADITLLCTDPTTMDETGMIELNTNTPSGNNGYATDNCGISGFDITSEMINVDCGQGTIEREFTAFTSSSDSKSCVQTITIEPDPSFFVTFPEDVELTGCANMTDIDMVGEPIITGFTCAEIFINFEDDIFTSNSGACRRVVRTYTVRNMCIDIDQNTTNPGGIAVDDSGLKFQVVDGLIVHTQIIDIVDDTPPVFDLCEELITVDTDPNDCSASVNINVSASDICSSELDYFWRVDIDGNIENNVFGFDDSIEGVFPVGTHTAFAQASDGCGNTEFCRFTITVEDRKKPTPFCGSGVNTVIMNGGARSVEIWALDLIQMGSSFDNCTNNEDLMVTVALATDPNPSGAPRDSSVTITCDDLIRDANGNALPTNFTIQVFVQDSEGNFDFCTSEVQIIDTENDCGTTANGAAQIAGRIYNEEQEDVEDVTVNVINNTQNMPPYVTQTDGSYIFPDLDMNDDYTVEPAKDIDVFDGVTTLDLVILAKHILGISELDSPYKHIAADVNMDGVLNINDLIEIRQLILFAIDEFSTQRSWLFVEASYEFMNLTNPLAENFPQVIDVNNLSADIAAANFIGVKLGDLDNSAAANTLLDIDERSFNPTAIVAINNQTFTVGEEIVIPFKLNDMDLMSGMQFTLEYNPANLEFTGFSGAAIQVSESNFGYRLIDEGIITFSWNTFSGAAMDVSDNDLFELRFLARSSSDISSELQLNSRYTAASAFNTEGEFNVALNILSESGIALNTNVFELYQNEPNPFRINTSIGFNLPEASAATLRIMDISGKELRVIKDNFSRGYNKIDLDLSSLKGNGVLYYQLETATHAATNKMIVIE